LLRSSCVLESFGRGLCQIRWNTGSWLSVANSIHALDPKDMSSYIFPSNVYSARREIKEKGLKRITGCSWIEVQDKVHVFFNGDCRRHESDEIYSMLEACFYSMEDAHEHSIV
jgi:hypothetical protein